MSDKPISPQVMAKFKQYWPRFENSKLYRDSDSALGFDDNAPSVIQMYLSDMAEISGLKPAEWTIGDIRRSLERFANEKPDDFDEIMTLLNTLRIIETFLDWLSAINALHLREFDIWQVMDPIKTGLTDRVDAALGIDELNESDDERDADAAFIEEDDIGDQSPDEAYQPDESYLNQPHVDKIGDQQWQLATATSVHDQLLKYIRLAWAAEDSQDLRDAYSQSVVIDAVVQMGDALYAQHLETLETWEAEHFLDYITNTIHTQPLEKSQALIASWIHLLLYLIFNDKIEREHGDELLAMFARGAQLLPKPKPKGRAVSLSDYKRGKRKSKKRRKKR